MKKYLAELAILIPVFLWFIMFVADTYKLQAEVTNTKSDIQEIKQDVKYIKNYLLEKK